MNFHSLYDQGFARVAAVTLPVHPAQPLANAEEIIAAAQSCDERGVSIALFPELCVSGYAIDDLLLQDVLLDEVERALTAIITASVDLLPLIVVGAPLRKGAALYNCAIAIHRGRALAVIPKSYLPNYREFYEKRHFVTPPSFDNDLLQAPTEPYTGDAPLLPFGSVTIDVTDIPGLCVGIEVCEDMWVPVTPASLLALSGATVLLNLSASPITVGRGDERKLLAQSTSARCACAYVYTAAGPGESTTDLAWDGQTLIYEAGQLLAAGQRFASGTQITIADVDVEHLRTERTRQNSFTDNAQKMLDGLSIPRPYSIAIEMNPPRTDLGLEREVDRFPFVPDDPSQLEQDCYEAYNIQVAGLAKRLSAIGQPKVVIGVSGGLDSTHALIVAARAMDLLGRPRTDILGYTLPGFATSARTKTNAIALCESLGVSFKEIDITPAARQMLADIDHPYADGHDDYDVTFENVQAGLRTDYLFRLANHLGGIVLGTGDLSELALGWCTYGVVSSGQFSPEVGEILLSILGTEISPELVPAKPGQKMQSTQDKIGPYNLQDFNLYYVLRRGARPSKIAFLAEHAWSNASQGDWPAGYPEEDKVSYSLDEIVKWERLFIRRYFTQQFKRSALPNGPKVMAGGSLSPRGDWRMPSDVSAEAWLRELDSAVSGLVA